jgi:hypothetical protein
MKGYTKWPGRELYKWRLITYSNANVLEENTISKPHYGTQCKEK